MSVPELATVPVTFEIVRPGEGMISSSHHGKLGMLQLTSDRDASGWCAGRAAVLVVLLNNDAVLIRVSTGQTESISTATVPSQCW